MLPILRIDELEAKSRFQRRRETGRPNSSRPQQMAGRCFQAAAAVINNCAQWAKTVVHLVRAGLLDTSDCSAAIFAHHELGFSTASKANPAQSDNRGLTRTNASFVAFAKRLAIRSCDERNQPAKETFAPLSPRRPPPNERSCAAAQRAQTALRDDRLEPASFQMEPISSAGSDSSNGSVIHLLQAMG